MSDHSSIQVKLDCLLNRVDLATLVTRLLQHAKDPVVALDVITGPIDVVPSQKHDHLVEFVLADFLKGLGQKCIGLVRGVVHHPGAAIAGTLLRDARFKEPVKLLVESPKELKLRRNLEHQGQIIAVLITEFVVFAHNEILMLPDEGRLLLLRHPLTTLPLVSGSLAGTPPAFLAPFVPLAFDLVFDRPHPIQYQFVDLLDDMENTELMLQALPVTLQTVFVQRRAIGNRHDHD